MWVDHFLPLNWRTSVYIPIVFKSAQHGVRPAREGCVPVGILSLHLIFLIVYDGEEMLLPLQ